MIPMSCVLAMSCYCEYVCYYMYSLLKHEAGFAYSYIVHKKQVIPEIQSHYIHQ